MSEQQLDEVLSTIEREIKRDNLAFNVVFQRAYFLAFVQLRLVTDWHLDELAPDDVDFSELDAGDANDLGEPGEPEAPEAGVPDGDGLTGDSIDERTLHLAVRAKRFVTAMNALVDAVPNILDPECTFTTPDGEEQRFWLGTFLTADRGSRLHAGRIEARAGGHLLGRRDADVRRTGGAGYALRLRRLLVEGRGSRHELHGGRVWRSVKRFSDKETSAGGADSRRAGRAVRGRAEPERGPVEDVVALGQSLTSSDWRNGSSMSLTRNPYHRLLRDLEAHYPGITDDYESDPGAADESDEEGCRSIGAIDASRGGRGAGDVRLSE